MTNPMERKGREKNSSLELAIADILAQEHLELFHLSRNMELGSGLALVADVDSIDDPTLKRLVGWVHEISTDVRNANSNLKRGESCFAVDEKHPEDPLWGTEEAVMRRTRALAGLAEQVGVIAQSVFNGAQRRSDQSRREAENAELAPLKKAFEGMFREQVLENLVELFEKLVEVSREEAELRAEQEFGSEDVTNLYAKIDATFKLRLELEKKIKAAKQVAVAKKST